MSPLRFATALHTLRDWQQILLELMDSQVLQCDDLREKPVFVPLLFPYPSNWLRLAAPCPSVVELNRYGFGSWLGEGKYLFISMASAYGTLMKGS